MNGTLDSLLHKVRYVIAGILTVVGILFLILLVASVATAKVADSDTGPVASMYDGPNAVTSGMSTLALDIDNALSHANQRAVTGFKGIGATLNKSSRFMMDSTESVGATIAHGSTKAAMGIAHVFGTSVRIGTRSLVEGITFVAGTTNSVVGIVAYNPVMNAVTRPTDQMASPVIDPHPKSIPASLSPTPEIQATQAAAAPKANEAPAWPIHGAITTYFGVPHWPFQPTHTGLDISDGWRSGVTPIHPYRSGRVVQVIHGNSGLGNHVIVDHGGGITSVYGHMYSTAAQEGQTVDQSSVLGLEGSTGASTGTHLHFEIRVNGTPVNPLDYVPGKP